MVLNYINVLYFIFIRLMNFNELILLKKELNLDTDRERQMPVSIEDVEITHKIRYLFIRNQILEKFDINANILDYGCGCGYGCKILSEVCNSVEGIEINSNCLEYARIAFNSDNIIYSNKFENKKYDSIVCVEMIEHISLNEGINLLKKFYENLEEEGFLFLTTPRKPYGNPYHIYEYTHNEMITYLKEAGFSEIESYGQVFDLIDKHTNLLDYYLNREKYTMIFICKK